MYIFPHKFPLEFYEVSPAQIRSVGDAKGALVEPFQRLMEQDFTAVVRNTNANQPQWTLVNDLWREVIASPAGEWTAVEVRDVRADLLVGATGELITRKTARPGRGKER
jgi:hypothetical protein